MGFGGSTAAAFSVATLYKTSRRTTKRAYNAGYAAACQDLLAMIQQGVSALPTVSTHGMGNEVDGEESEGRTISIGRIMDYVEARLEAIRAREEEEEEDDEREKERERKVPAMSTVGGGRGSTPAVMRTRDTVRRAASFRCVTSSDQRLETSM